MFQTPSSRSMAFRGEHRFVIYNGAVYSANIMMTHQNSRGIVVKFSVLLNTDNENITDKYRDIHRKHVFQTREAAEKALFRFKLKGEL